MFRKLKNIYHLFQAVIASVVYGFPSKKLICIGVTGTDGKSTTSSLIYEILQNAGRKAGLISTLGCKINEKDFSIGLHTTTPSSFVLQKLLKKMVDSGCEFAVIEVASHGIDQRRIWGIYFEIGVLTNITREHLDYHKNFEDYTQVKLSFLAKCKIKIFNFKFSKGENIISYGINKGDYQAVNIEKNKFTLQFKSKNFIVEHNLFGEFNVENILAAIAVSDVLKIEMDKIILGIKEFKGIKGRMEEIENDKGLHVFVDFAHTPNAIFQVLKTLREKFPKSKIIHIFGATGKRDKEKRPLMGEISGKMADVSILTSEDTYGDDPNKIIEMIEAGIKKTNKILNKTYFIVSDRRLAFEKGVSIAKSGDVIVATGVGHQTSMNVGHEIEWSDQEEFKKILSNKIW